MSVPRASPHLSARALQELAPYFVRSGLPGIIGPVPPPLSMRGLQ